MIWSIDELVKIIRCGEKVVVDNVMGELSNPQNYDLFSKENFSLLWGILGVAGIKGTNELSQRKIWESMKKNQALDAFDKELLADFTQYIGKDVLDNRLFAWNGLDNLQADMKFKKTILMPFVKIDRNYAYQVNMQAFNPIRVIGLLDRIELSDDIKDMLVNVRGSGAACGISGEDIIDHYEKEKILMKLCEMVAFATRILKQHEKRFLFNYFRNAVLDGFKAEKIGLNDDVLVKLVASEDKNLLSEIEKSALYQHNWELAEFAKEIDIKDGFYEKLASKLIDYDPTMLQSLYERCLFLMDTSQPRGCVFALELINKNKIKSAVKMLIELAKRGKATEAAIFLHRLLPKSKGSEVMIMSILRYNLKQLRKNQASDYIDVFGEYVARMYLIGIRSFVKANLLREATVLIVELVKNGWINGVYSLEVACAELINEIVCLKNGLGGTLIPLANDLNLNVYRKSGLVLLAKDEEHLKINLVGRISVYEKDGVVNIDDKKVNDTVLENKEDAFAQVEEVKDIEAEGIENGYKEDDGKVLDIVEENVVKADSVCIEDVVIEDNSKDTEVSENVDVEIKVEEDEKIVEEGVIEIIEEKTEEVEFIEKEELGENIEEKIKDEESTQESVVSGELIYNTENEGGKNEDGTYEESNVIDDDISETFKENSEEVTLENIDTDDKTDDNKVESIEVIEKEEEVVASSVEEVEDIVKVEGLGENLLDDKEPNIEFEALKDTSLSVDEGERAQTEVDGIEYAKDLVSENVDINGDLSSVKNESVDKEVKSEEKEFDEWNEKEEAEDRERKLIKNKVLNFNIKDIDKHFSKVKKIAEDVVNRADNASEHIINNVKKTNLYNFKSVNRIKDIAKKISFKKKS